MTHFAAALERLRQQAGFPTAYRFYHRNGGRRSFGFTYVHYLRFEKGAALPRPESLPVLHLALRLSPGQAGTRELVFAYLRDLLKTEEAFHLVTGPLMGAAPTGAAEARAAAAPPVLSWIKAEHTVHLTPEQFEAVAADEAAYWASEALLNDGGSWSAGEVAAAFGVDERAAQRGLARLKAVGLARAASKGRYKAREAGKLYTFPGRLAGMGPALARVQGYWEKMHRKTGRDVLARVELVRAQDAAAKAYATSLSEAVDAANAYSTRAKDESTGLFLIESRIRRLCSF